MDLIKQFESHLEINPYDQQARNEFIDWLYENGYDDLANEHTLWTVEWQQAKDWLVGFSKQLGVSIKNYEEQGYWDYPTQEYIKNTDYIEDIEVIDYDLMMKTTAKWLDTAKPEYVYGDKEYWEGEVYVQFGNERARNLFSGEETKKLFWKNYEIVTRQTIDNVKKGIIFRCSC